MSVWKSVLLMSCLTCLQLAYPQTEKKNPPNSPVFKSYQPPTTAPLLEQSDATYQMWQGFRVMQQANAENPVSQFELSIRYLTGRGFKADTAKAAYWAARAATKNHLLARYNLAIFQFNGWGTEWNPFDAYRNFRTLAEKNVAEAQYVLAQFLTENLVVPSNWDEAYRWVKLAADSGYGKATETLKEFEKRGYHPTTDSANRKTGNGANPNASGAVQLQFLSFSPDTTKAPSDSVLFEDAIRAAMLSKDKEVQRIFSSLDGSPDPFKLDSTTFGMLVRSANAGSPEALVLMGWFHERGVNVQRDVVKAALQYIRAIRLDSPRASRILFELVQRKDLFAGLKQRVGKNDPDALYVWSCLIALGFDRQLTDVQALQMLERAVAKEHIPSIVEMGLSYYSGRWVSRNEERASELWQRAALLGSNEAIVRLAIMNIRKPLGDHTSAVGSLRQAADNGSVLAEVALAYCYETGVGVSKSYAEAAQLYRASVQRGSQDAHRALLRMHDSIRPDEKEFHLSN